MEAGAGIRETCATDGTNGEAAYTGETVRLIPRWLWKRIPHEHQHIRRGRFVLQGQVDIRVAECPRCGNLNVDIWLDCRIAGKTKTSLQIPSGWNVNGGNQVDLIQEIMPVKRFRRP